MPYELYLVLVFLGKRGHYAGAAAKSKFKPKGIYKATGSRYVLSSATFCPVPDLGLVTGTGQFVAGQFVAGQFVAGVLSFSLSQQT